MRDEDHAAGDLADADTAQQQQQQHQPEAQQEASAGQGGPTIAPAVPQQEEGGTGGVEPGAGGGMPLVSVPSFLAAAAVPGAEAEEEDYDA